MDLHGAAGQEVHERALQEATLQKQVELLDEVLSDKFKAWMFALTEGYKHDAVMRLLAMRYPYIGEFYDRYLEVIQDPQVQQAWKEHLEHEGQPES